MQAIILAGGKGVRLKPYTLVLPKPLMPVHEQPIIDILVRQLKRHGVSEVIASLGYLHRLIKIYLGNGDQFGLAIRYLVEDSPLGTAGSISLIDGLKDDFIVINGDTLCDVNFKDMHRCHLKNQNAVTIGVFRMKYQIDLGVVEMDDENHMIRYNEKPQIDYLVSMGVYIFNEKILPFLDRGVKIDLPDLVISLRDRGLNVGCYEHRGFWLDMGRPSDFTRANEDEVLLAQLMNMESVVVPRSENSL